MRTSIYQARFLLNFLYASVHTRGFFAPSNLPHGIRQRDVVVVEPSCVSSKCIRFGRPTYDAESSLYSSYYSNPVTSMSGEGEISAARGATGGWPPKDRLSSFVTESNLVDYTKLARQEQEWLAPVIDLIRATDPGKMDPAERHAFLINAYNLWTIHWVIRERRTSRWQGATSWLTRARFFYWHKVSTGAGATNLFNLENKVIRNSNA